MSWSAARIRHVLLRDLKFRNADPVEDRWVSLGMRALSAIIRSVHVEVAQALAGSSGYSSPNESC